jgi:hypothetical protein
MLLLLLCILMYLLLLRRRLVCVLCLLLNALPLLLCLRPFLWCCCIAGTRPNPTPADQAEGVGLLQQVG